MTVMTIGIQISIRTRPKELSLISGNSTWQGRATTAPIQHAYRHALHGRYIRMPTELC